MGDLLIRLAAVRPGEEVLDVGCGTGELTLKLAKIAYPGRVLGIDNAPGRRHKYFLSPAEPQRFYEALRARFTVLQLGGAARRVREWGPQLKAAGATVFFWGVLTR